MMIHGLVLTGLILTRTIDVQTRVLHTASYAQVSVPVGSKLTNNADLFIHVGHMLDRERFVDMGLFNREQTGCDQRDC
mgnify:CR=1 FL=1